MDIYLVEFKGSRKEYFTNPDCLSIKIGNLVIVQVERGEDMGRVTKKVPMEMVELEKKPQNILRLAIQDDLNKLTANREREKDCVKQCEKMIAERNLEMKLVDAEWQFDGNKIIFYFTAEKRVDFRQLVKDLAAIFKTRIELKQIGVRDEARRIGGCGRCGYKLCCTTFLDDFEPVTLRAAKDQRLSLNPSQISGICGRLMCCLIFEREFYKDQTRKFPKEGKEFITTEGRTERVSGLDLFNEFVELENKEGFRRKISLEEFNKTAREFLSKNNPETRKKLRENE
jgi:cell fate regulator YaaT (PSP1 superfamily)